MGVFTTELDVRWLGGRQFVLLNELVFVAESGFEARVPPGFATDLASIPRLFWWAFPPDGQYAKAAVLHDFLYTESVYSRQWADNLFLEAMSACQVPAVTKWLVYTAVRLWGWRFWQW